jgi:Ni,Fe-hydrogenase I cytochrome b subunit
MRLTYVTVYRPETQQLVQHLPVQVDQMSERELVDHASLNQWHVVDTWRIYTLYLPTPAYQLQRGDVLKDEMTINPDSSGKPYTYRIVGLVKTYDDHQECIAETPRK